LSIKKASFVISYTTHTSLKLAHDDLRYHLINQTSGRYTQNESSWSLSRESIKVFTHEYFLVDKSITSNQFMLCHLAIFIIAFELERKYVASQTSTIDELFTAHSFTLSDRVA
jgi:glucan phosphorylase